MDEIIGSRILDIETLFSNTEAFPQNLLLKLANDILETFQAGKKIAFVGNGGSAAEAMHLAAEFTGKCVIPHRPLPALCLNESQSALTAIVNDFGIEYMFSRMVDSHLQEGDILIALSTSGKSKNIIEALSMAKKKQVNCYLWTGSDSPNIEGVEIWKVPSSSTPRIQEIHLAWGHIIAEAVESKI
jgi:D-sedoheptulose 7-phosphate isomerase